MKRKFDDDTDTGDPDITTDTDAKAKNKKVKWEDDEKDENSSRDEVKVVFNKSLDVTIHKLETKKDLIKQPEAAQLENGMMIPPLGSAVLISGKSGSGKSTLLANLIMDKRFYNGFFDMMFLFSPTANGDDIQKQLCIPKNHICTDLEEAPDWLDLIIDSQTRQLSTTTADKAPQYAIIFDDIIGNVMFMNTPQFVSVFYRVRHINCTTFMLTQHFTRVPRVCRLQANFIMYFRGSQSEQEIIVEEFSPPGMHKDEFRHLVFNSTCNGFDFLTINMKVGWEGRFRHNLGDLIHIDTKNMCHEVTNKRSHGKAIGEPPEGGTQPRRKRQRRIAGTRERADESGS